MKTSNTSANTGCLSPAASALLAILRHDDACDTGVRMRDLPSQTWEGILEVALAHGVAPLLHRALQSSGTLTAIPDHIRECMEENRRAIAFANLRNLGELGRIAQALRERNIPVIVLKGLHLAELVYRDISLRPMVDLDLLVPSVQRRTAMMILREQGYKFEESTLEHGFEHMPLDAVESLLDRKYHVGMIHGELGIAVEIHWNLADPLHPYSPPIEDIWNSAVPARVGGTDTLVMSPEYLLLHVCAHLAYNHVFAFSLRALCDVVEILCAYPALDWTATVERGRRYGWRRGVAVALQLAKDELGAAVSEEALSSISGSALEANLLTDARAHLIAAAAMPDHIRAAPNFMDFAGRREFAAKLKIAWSRLFVRRAELALIYGVPEHSAYLGIYYVARLFDLTRRYAATIWGLSVAESDLHEMTDRHARLARWLDGA